MFFYEQHFVHIFAWTRWLGTKLDVTEQKILTSEKPIAYYESLRKEVFKTGMTYNLAI